MTEPLRHLIDGVWCAVGPMMNIINPSDGQVLTQAPNAPIDTAKANRIDAMTLKFMGCLSTCRGACR